MESLINVGSWFIGFAYIFLSVCVFLFHSISSSIPYLLLSLKSSNFFLLLFLLIYPPDLPKSLLLTSNYVCTVQSMALRWMWELECCSFLAWLMPLPPSPFFARQCPRAVCGGCLEGSSQCMGWQGLHQSWLSVAYTDPQQQQWSPTCPHAALWHLENKSKT